MPSSPAQVRASVAVIGAGAVGGVLARSLYKANHDVSLCVRAPVPGLQITTPARVENVPVRVATDPREVGPAAWVFLTVKSYDTQGSRRWLSALCDENTTVVVVQNGLDRAQEAQMLAPQASFLQALAYIHAEREGPGRIRLGYGNRLDIPDTAASPDLRELFRGSGVTVRVQPDFITASWRKLLLNVAVNPITAITLRRGEVFTEPTVRDLARAIMRETMEVGKSVGARLTEADVQGALEFTTAMGKENGTSMLYDRMACRPLEYEVLNGAVVKYAEKAGIEVPVNRAVLTFLHALEPGFLREVG